MKKRKKSIIETWDQVAESDPVSKIWNDNAKELETLIKKIVLRRNELGLSQANLAKKVGIPTSTIGRIEILANVPKLDTFIRILSAMNSRLDVSFTYKLETELRFSKELLDSFQEEFHQKELIISQVKAFFATTFDTYNKEEFNHVDFLQEPSRKSTIN
ncbi:MAG: helix-turn-helix transcriptional regulator [Erysipelotrichaceae bacterium]|jgi:transcriptional regulator with XRE-family HTH domain|nr:helix-turn-helix transcriptional regulator [Erysipelotrichaceae bacterium]